MVQFTWRWLDNDIEIIGPVKLKFFETLEVEGFDDDGICEVFYDFIDWREIFPEEPAPIPCTYETMLHAIEEWNMIEELGLSEYANTSNIKDVLVDICMQEWNYRISKA